MYFRSKPFSKVFFVSWGRKEKNESIFSSSPKLTKVLKTLCCCCSLLPLFSGRKKRKLFKFYDFENKVTDSIPFRLPSSRTSKIVTFYFDLPLRRICKVLQKITFNSSFVKRNLNWFFLFVSIILWKVEIVNATIFSVYEIWQGWNVRCSIKSH